jgi:alkanesulfonate monooxygenase SsuD/methylene tetrahydromethanopterin reductase-like flavin-dependent oxidoreductase (luciferase family)
MVGLGYGEAAERIQELFLAGRREEAIEAVPDDYLDETALVGPPARIRERFQAWADSGITGLTIGAHGAGASDTLELMADMAGVRPTAVTMR